MKVRWALAVLAAIMALAVSAVPVAVLGRNLAEAKRGIAVRSAQSRFLSLHHLSRSLAVERGVYTGFVADPETQIVTVREGCTGEGRILASRDFNLSYRVDLLTGGRKLEMCMTPRGYADLESNSFNEQERVTFLRGEHTASVLLFPLGQAVEP